MNRTSTTGIARLLISTALGAACARAADPLAIVNAAIRQIEDGAPLPPGFTYTPGEILIFSFQVSGYRVSNEKIHLTYDIDALDPKGVRLTEPITGTVEAALAPQDKEWKPKVHPEIAIPPMAGSGVYKIVAHVIDDIGKTEATKELPFEVRGHDVTPSDTLVVRNFHYHRSEDDPNPLATPAYRPGDSVWARFDITGYKFGPANNVDVSYSIAVLNAEGKVLFKQDQAAVEQGGSYYPRRYVPGQMSLNLQSNMRPGEYFIVVSVEDRVGGQKYETKQRFSVE